MIGFIRNAAAILGAAVFALAIAGCDAPSGGSDGGYVGKYTTEDTQGQPMAITLADDGSAVGDRGGENLTGSWKVEGGSAVITWSEEWTTKIAKDGDKYTKTAYKDGNQDGDPVGASKDE